MTYLFIARFLARGPYRRAALQLGEAPSRLYLWQTRIPGTSRPGPAGFASTTSCYGRVRQHNKLLRRVPRPSIIELEVSSTGHDDLIAEPFTTGCSPILPPEDSDNERKGVGDRGNLP